MVISSQLEVQALPRATPIRDILCHLLIRSNCFPRFLSSVETVHIFKKGLCGVEIVVRSFTFQAFSATNLSYKNAYLAFSLCSAANWNEDNLFVATVSNAVLQSLLIRFYFPHS